MRRIIFVLVIILVVSFWSWDILRLKNKVLVDVDSLKQPAPVVEERKQFWLQRKGEIDGRYYMTVESAEDKRWYRCEVSEEFYKAIESSAIYLNLPVSKCMEIKP